MVHEYQKRYMKSQKSEVKPLKNPLKLLVFILLTSFLLNGCFDYGQDLRLYSFEDLESILKEYNLEVKEIEMINSYRLEQVKTQKSFELDEKEKLFIYVFESEEDQLLGRKEIEKQTALIDTEYSPQFYEMRNVLMIYLRINGNEGIEEELNKIKKQLT